MAFIGVIILTTTFVLAYTALITLITGIDGLPQELDVRTVQGDDLQNASVIHLTNQDLKQYPVLASAIREASRDPGMPISGSAQMTRVEHLVLIESFGIDESEKNRPYLECGGNYYSTRVLIH